MVDAATEGGIDRGAGAGLDTAMPANQVKETASQQDGEPAKMELPPGVKLLRTLEGNLTTIRSVAFDPTGRTLASGSDDTAVKLWEVASGKLLRALEGHQEGVCCVAFDPSGHTLASGGADSTVKLWNPASGRLLRTLEGHQEGVCCVAFDPAGRTLASGSADSTVKLWDPASGKLLRTFRRHQSYVWSVTFDPTGCNLASAAEDPTVRVWEPINGKQVRTLAATRSAVWSLAFHPSGEILIGLTHGNTVKVWDSATGKLLRTLEGHTSQIDQAAFSSNGKLLASLSNDGTVRIWRCDTWETTAIIPEPRGQHTWVPALAFHPTLPLLATAASPPDTFLSVPCRQIHVWELNYDILLGKRGADWPATPIEKSIHHRTAKVIFVGDTGVGKSGLANRLVHGKFIDTRSSHARRTFILDSSTVKMAGGVDEHRETVLWDLAGQPAYRLVHQLSMEDAAVACVLCDARSETNPLEGAAYWSQALDQARTNAPISRLLVPARMDVGGFPVSAERLQTFAKERGFNGVFPTSAFTGDGCGDLLKAIREHIRWDDLPAVSSTETLAALRDFVARLKGVKAGGASVPASRGGKGKRASNRLASTLAPPTPPALLTIAELHRRFEADFGKSALVKMSTAHLIFAMVGDRGPKPVPMETFIAYLQRLEDTDAVDVLAFHSIGQAPKPETFVLLDPTRVDAYASALLVAAKDEPDGPGHLLEARVRSGDFKLADDERLGDKAAEKHLLWFVMENLFARDLAMRETIKGQDYVVFPAQCTRELKFPGKGVFGVACGFAGAVKNIYATLIAQLAHYEGFSKREFFENAAAYSADHHGRCLVRLTDHGNGTGELEVSFEEGTPPAVRQGFLEFVAKHLEAKSKPGSVTRRHAYHCAGCQNPFEDRVVKLRLDAGKKKLLCPVCERKRRWWICWPHPPKPVPPSPNRWMQTPNPAVSASPRSGSSRRRKRRANMTCSSATTRRTRPPWRKSPASSRVWASDRGWISGSYRRASPGWRRFRR